MDWLETYGKPIYQYRGSGILSEREIDSDRSVKVQFEIAQLFDGRIFCELKSDDHSLGKIKNDSTLIGFTEYGYELTASQIVITSSHTHFDPTSYSVRAIILKQVTVTTSDKEIIGLPFQTNFLVTNFNFFSKFLQCEGFCWKSSDYTMTLKPLPNHKANTEIIRATKSTGITSIIAIEPTKGITGLDESERLATKLCWLLSLAQGCYIGWISHESFLDNVLIARYHNTIPLLPPSGRQIIPADEDVFNGYIAHCLQVYDSKDQTWRIRLIIDMFVRAVMTQPFLEPVGLQLAVLMDYIRGIYSKSVGKERLIEESVFDNIKQELRSKIADVIKLLLPKTNAQLRKKMLRHIGLFQWYPFSDSVKGMAKSLNLNLPDTEIDAFVTKRDTLVHTYGFPSGKDSIEACKEMISFVTKFIFAILEYEGYFYDWSIPARDGWENRKIKLELSPRKEEKGSAG